jgi:hypothetical protein
MIVPLHSTKHTAKKSIIFVRQREHACNFMLHAPIAGGEKENGRYHVQSSCIIGTANIKDVDKDIDTKVDLDQANKKSCSTTNSEPFLLYDRLIATATARFRVARTTAAATAGGRIAVAVAHDFLSLLVTFNRKLTVN